jgi:predicted kinase
VSKDEIKEALADAFGAEPPSRAVFSVLYRFVRIQLRAGVSVVVEANFDPELGTRSFAAIREQHPFRLVQIFCGGDPEVLVDRYRERAESGERHPVHADEESAPEVEARIRAGEWRPLELEGELIEVDTTQDVDVDAVVKRVSASA